MILSILLTEATPYPYLFCQKSLRIPLPQAEEISLEKIGSPDHPVFLDSLLSDGDSVYSIETLHEILRTPEKTRFKCTGTPMKTCWKFWQS